MPLANVGDISAQVGGVDQSRAGGIQLARQRHLLLPARVVWKAPGVVGKLEDPVKPVT